MEYKWYFMQFFYDLILPLPRTLLKPTILLMTFFFLPSQLLTQLQLRAQGSSRQEVNCEKVLKILPMSIQSCIYTRKLLETKTKLPMYSVHCRLENIGWLLLSKICVLCSKISGKTRQGKFLALEFSCIHFCMRDLSRKILLVFKPSRRSC